MSESSRRSATASLSTVSSSPVDTGTPLPPRGGAIPVWTGIAGQVERFDLVVCDLWGVMHDGRHLSENAVHAIQKTRDAGVRTVFLTNAPRPRFEVRAMLEKMGLDPALTDRIVTSGGLARDRVRAAYRDARLYHLGPAQDRATIDGLPVREVDSLHEAEVILATHLEVDGVDAHRAYLRGAAERRVPLLCANPDRIVGHGETLYPCAGAVADLYAEMGGPVEWFGKPLKSAVSACMTEAGLPTVPAERVLLIGDSLQTDLPAAAAAGVEGALVAAGIHGRDLMPLLEGGMPQVPLDRFCALFGACVPVPQAILPGLSW